MRQIQLTAPVSIGASGHARAGISYGALKDRSLLEVAAGKACTSAESKRKIRELFKTFPCDARASAIQDLSSRLWIAMCDIDSSGTGNEIANQFYVTALSLDTGDRLFFTAYFVELCEKGLGNPQLDWKSLLCIAEKEAKEGSKFASTRIAKQFTLSEEGSVCPSTSPNFELGLFFRNVFRLAADVPEIKSFKSFPPDKENLSILPVWLSNYLGIGKLESMAAYDLFCSQQGRHTSVKSASGTRYLIMRELDVINIYRCKKSFVFAKGLGHNDSMHVWINTGRFNIFSPNQNRFFRARLNQGEPICLVPSHSHAPGPYLAKMFLDAEAEDKLRHKGSNRQKT